MDLGRRYTGVLVVGEYALWLLLLLITTGSSLSSMDKVLRRCSNCLKVVCSDWSEAMDCLHGGHRGYSSTSSHTMSDASVPPTVTNCRSPTINRAHANGPEYTFASTYSAFGVMHGYLRLQFKFYCFSIQNITSKYTNSPKQP